MANSKSFVFDYQGGKYGWNESPERGADSFHPFSNVEGNYQEVSPTDNHYVTIQTDHKPALIFVKRLGTSQVDYGYCINGSTYTQLGTSGHTDVQNITDTSFEVGLIGAGLNYSLGVWYD